MRKQIKRENGTGSVYKRSDTHARPWCAVTPEKDNVPAQIIGHYATAQEAKDALENYRRTPTTKLNITLNQLHAEWQEIAYRNISTQTQKNYSACWQKLTTLYDIKFRELRTGQMQKVIDQYSNMSSSTLQKTKSLLTQLFDYGSENDIVNKNYASFITLPKTIKIKKDCFTELELSKIEKAAVPYADVILMMCYTGFRVSEFLELTPFSYSRENNALTGGKKTEAGKNRVVPVHPKIERILLGWLARGGQTIVTDDNGDPMTAEQFRQKYYYPALTTMGIRRLTPHATRHTFATRLSAGGARMEDIQALAGHEKYDETANTYIHQNIDTLRTAILKMT